MPATQATRSAQAATRLFDWLCWNASAHQAVDFALVDTIRPGILNCHMLRAGQAGHVREVAGGRS